MVGKRVATHHISKDHPEVVSSSGDEEQQPNTNNTIEDLPVERKISKPGRRINREQGPATTATASSAIKTKNPFAILKSLPNEKLQPFNLESFAPPPPPPPFQEPEKLPLPMTEVFKSEEFQYLRKIRGLNHCFAESLHKKLEKDPTADLTLLFKQYQDHLEVIKKDYNQAKAVIRVEGKDKVTLDQPTNNPPPPTLLSNENPTISSTIALTMAAANPPTAAQMENGNEKKESEKTFLVPKFSFGVVSPPSLEGKKDDTAIGTTTGTTTGTNTFPLPFSFGAQAKPFTLSPIPTINNQMFPSTTDGDNTNTDKDKGTVEKPFSFTNAPMKFSFGNPNLDDTKVLPGSSLQFSFSSPLVPSFGMTTTATTTTPFINSNRGETPSSKKENDKDDQYSGGGGIGNDEGGEGDDNSIPIGEEESFSSQRTNNELIKTGVGEEDESTVIEQQCKLFILDKEQGWTDLGSTIFKVNQKNENADKSRILARAEGSGKIILNSWINSAVQVEHHPGKKQFTILCFNQDSKPAKYLVRCKEATQAEQLSTSINSLKPSSTTTITGA